MGLNAGLAAAASAAAPARPPAPQASRLRLTRTFANADGAHCLVWIVVQQGLVAASTVLLVLSAQAAASGDVRRAAVLALLFAFALVVVYVPNTLSLFYLQRWTLSSFERFMHRFVAANRGQTMLRHPQPRARHEPWLTNESIVVYESVTQLSYEMASTVLSTLLNVAVIAFTVDPAILVWYALAGFVLALANWLTQRRIQGAAAGLQDTRKDLSAVLLAAWENVFGGNAVNLRAWSSRFAARLQSMRRAAVRYDVTRSAISGLTVTLAVGLIATGNGMFFVRHEADPVALAALLITLPRQLQTIQNIFAFFNLTLALQGVRSQFRALEGLVNLDGAAESPDRHIDLSRIEISVDGTAARVGSARDFMTLLAQGPARRITLRSPNGAGKSTLLAYAAQQLHPQRVYLPAYTVDLSFETFDPAAHSDGRRVLATLEELGRCGAEPFVFLDEWDANLDAANVASVDALIAEWVRRGRTVVEARHRR